MESDASQVPNRRGEFPPADYRAIFEAAPEPYLVLDPRFVIVGASAAYLRAAATRREDLVGKSVFELAPEAPTTPPFPELGASLRRVSETLAPDAMPARPCGEGPTDLWRFLNCPVLGPDGGLACILHRAEAVTELARLERRATAALTRLQAANQEFDSFAYAISHDLRAPLRAMSGFAIALEEDYGTALTGEARDFLQEIVLASRRLGERIDGLLALSRSTRGELRRTEVDLSDLAERVLADLASAEPTRRVSWQVEPGLTVRGAPGMLAAVLKQLIGNAWKYTAKADAPSIRVYAEQGDGGRRYCIADNGVGFDMEAAQQLFKPFARLHRQDEFPGIGIGLATVQRIIHRHGGKVEASAVPGSGARFCFTLPDGDTNGDEMP